MLNVVSVKVSISLLMNILKMVLDMHDWGNNIKLAPNVERGKRKTQSRQQTVINSLSNANETSAPTPLPYDYILNINTLNGETFTIQMVRRREEDECIEYLSTTCCIKAHIASHYKRKILGKCIYGTKDDGYFCGATEDVKNEIKRYEP